MSFYLCTAPGCNRKYKTDKKWLQHMEKAHPDIQDPVLPELLDVKRHKRGGDSSWCSPESQLGQANTAIRNSNAGLIHAAKLKRARQLRRQANDEIKIKEAAFIQLQKKLAEEKAALTTTRLREEKEKNERFAKQQKLFKEHMNQDSSYCVVCMEEPRTVVLVPCGHAMFCKDCSFAVNVCPICRVAIEKRITMYS